MCVLWWVNSYFCLWKTIIPQYNKRWCVSQNNQYLLIHQSILSEKLIASKSREMWLKSYYHPQLPVSYNVGGKKVNTATWLAFIMLQCWGGQETKCDGDWNVILNAYYGLYIGSFFTFNIKLGLYLMWTFRI